VEGVGHAVVLAGLPDDRVGVVLAGVVDGHSHAQREGCLALPDRLAAVVAALIGGDAVAGVEPVEGAFAIADVVAVELGVGVGELAGQADTLPRKMLARPLASPIVAARSVCRLKYSVVAKVTAAWGLSASCWRRSSTVAPRHRGARTPRRPMAHGSHTSTPSEQHALRRRFAPFGCSGKVGRCRLGSG
jgi:hypothetical protein